MRRSGAPTQVRMLAIFLRANGLMDAEDENITVLKNGHHVARSSDFIMYAVEAEYIDRVVAEFGPCALAACLFVRVS